MKSVSIKQHRRGHPWIFSNEVRKKEPIGPGEIVDIYQGKRFLGRGFYHPHSLIAVRKFSNAVQEFAPPFVDAMIAKALEYRKAHVRTGSFRLVYSESDGLPGLIVDKYEATFVVQINCYGMDARRELVFNSLLKLGPDCIYERSDTSQRTLEGLEPRTGLVAGRLENPVGIELDGLAFQVDIERGQKTGFFLDLGDIRRKAEVLARGRKVLDLFCYTGAFSCYAARGDAVSVTGVDSSAAAVDLAIDHSRRNELKNTAFIRADAFDFLRYDKETYDLIILDPPSFTKSKKGLSSARRGYKEINIQAMKRLNRQGILITTSCSHHVSEEMFLQIIREAVHDAAVDLRVIDRATQSMDHPILVNMPESHYLKCLILQRAD
ncbi:class I SAM-dependent rRNA methyltransferase [candidate division WOR-3 bacterium]|nr:class I SAM-dependent rRNA methyltransferase [candidate division WOR-3 bacterium]